MNGPSTVTATVEYAAGMLTVAAGDLTAHADTLRERGVTREPGNPHATIPAALDDLADQLAGVVRSIRGVPAVLADVTRGVAW